MKLTISNLSKTYPNGVQALKNISLSIDSGMFGLLGQNGAGKSTLMQIIATLQDASFGDVFNDIDVSKQPIEIRKVLGYLPQEFGVYPNVTAEELLMHIATLKGVISKSERRDQIHELLHKTNLYDVRKKKLDSYSGGMKQRFGIAQSLLGNPKIIIVDEPTAGLDPVERNRFYNLLAQLGEDRIVILSTHIVEDVSTLCNEMAIIGHGEVIGKGKPHEIAKSVKGMLYEASVERHKLTQYQNKYNVISQHYYAGNMKVTVKSDKKPDSSFSPKSPNLEDAYFVVLSQLNLNK